MHFSALVSTAANSRKITQADFNRRPESRGLRRQVELSADGSEVSIELLDQRRDKRYALQLKAPPAR